MILAVLAFSWTSFFASRGNESRAEASAKRSGDEGRKDLADWNLKHNHKRLEPKQSQVLGLGP